MADPRLSTSSSEYYVESSSTKRVVLGSRALTNDTEPGIVNCLRDDVSIKPPVTEDIILSRSQHLKPKCRMRKVSSKAAVLVLIWNILFSSTRGFVGNFEVLFLNDDLISVTVPVVVFVLVALLYFLATLPITLLGDTDRQRLHSHYCLQLPFCSVYWW